MHIAHVNFASGFRGGERQTLLLCQELAKKNIQQTLVVKNKSPLIKYAQSIPQLTIKALNKPYFLSAFSLKADLVHAHEAKACHFAYTHYRLKKTPYVITRRVTNPIKASALKQAIYRNSSRNVCLSKAILKQVSELSRANQAIVIPSMCANLKVDKAAVAAIKTHYKDAFLIGNVGALVDKHKGQSYLIKAFNQLQQTLPNIKLLILGEGYDREALSAMATAGIDMPGYKENVGDYLSAFDCFVFPSLQEGLGSTLLDAMQATLPIIASDVDGIPDIIHHEKNGLLVPPGDSEALAQAIERLYHERSLARQLADNGHHFAEDFKPHIISERYHQLYNNILNNQS